VEPDEEEFANDLTHGESSQQAVVRGVVEAVPRRVDGEQRTVAGRYGRGETNPPTPLEIITLTLVGLSVAVAYLGGGGRHATSLVVVWQVVGVDAEFGHATTVILAGQTIGPFNTGRTVNFKTRGSNSVVAQPVESAVKTITVS